MIYKVCLPFLLPLAVTLGGCAVTVRPPVAELAPPVQPVEMYDESLEAPANDAGSGPLRAAQLDEPRVIEPVIQPFAGYFAGRQSPIFEYVGPRIYAQPWISTQSTRYNGMKQSRTIRGGVLIGVGTALIAIGAYGIYEASQMRSTSDWNDGLGPLNLITTQTNPKRDVIMFFSIIGLLGGVGMVIPGIYLVATDPPKKPYGVSRVQPKLHLGPGGAGVSVAF